MSSKDKPSKKAVREKKEKIVEDATFGLKNKNKSAKVKQFIERVEKGVKNSHGGAEAAKAKEMKKEAKLAKQLQEEELRILFNEGITNQFGKKKSKTQDAAAALGLTEANKAVSEFLEGMSSDSDSDSEDEKNGPIYISIDEAPTEVFREKTIEDLIDEQRQKLASEGKAGTPVTSESFAKWRAGKLQQRQAAAEARLKAEHTKKKGGKGLSVLSGKELFSYNASLFVDDDAAIDASDEKDMAVQTQLEALREEARAREESERIQAEQNRLAEAQLLEMEVRGQKEEARRRAAAEKKFTFVMNNVIINQVVFEDDEMEDLTPFPEEKLVESIVHTAVDISAFNYVDAASSSGAIEGRNKDEADDVDGSENEGDDGEEEDSSDGDDGDGNEDNDEEEEPGADTNDRGGSSAT